MGERLPIRDALLSFAPGESLKAALFLTYSFDGRWFEEALVPDLFERPIATMLVIRDRNALCSEAPSVRYRKANAARSAVFHPKLCLLVADDRARAVITSANLTRGGYERQRELGRVFDLSPDCLADYTVFQSLADYLDVGLSQEVRGDSAQELAEIARSLKEVVEKLAAPSSLSAHTLMHSYREPIWHQVLARLPHRVLRRALVVSPFFEPDRQRPEDPALGPDDTSIFARLLFEDFEYEPSKDEVPVRVFFRQSEGRTELPVQKLSALSDRVQFFMQDERDDRLHAKLLLLEGSEGPGREPYLVALHGSPNFTTAGLLQRPPFGNSELAILTSLPAKRKAFAQTVHALGLDEGFSRVMDLTAMKTEGGDAPPSPPTQGVADATYRVADGIVVVTLLEATPVGARIRLLVQRDGAWLVVGDAEASEVTIVQATVSGLAEVDGKTKLLELRGATLRVEVVDANGQVLSSDVTPVNVDIPHEFCGLTLVGAALLSLDERILRAGIGAAPTYREQLKWLEARRATERSEGKLIVVSHQADLDRFYRNVNQGLRGVRTRARGSQSLFTLRRSLDELSRWAMEATTVRVSDEHPLSVECRLFLLEQLLRCAREICDGAPEALRERLKVIELELKLSKRWRPVLEWLDGLMDPAFVEYAASARVHLDALGEAIP